MKINKSFAVISLLSLSILTACGGSSSTNGLKTGNTTHQPQQLSGKNLEGFNVLSRDVVNAPVVTTTTDSITISYTAASGHLNGSHLQFFLNVDNDANTGFNFTDEAWEKAGTDYLIQDGFLFKSTSNDTSWNWEESNGQLSYQKTDSSVSVTINKSLLQGLKPTVKIGLMTRNADWDVEAIYPRSSLMAEYTLDITPPADSVAPVISLNGSSTLIIQQGSDFTDPGATANDDIDGVLTNQIVATSNVDTSQVGSYQITYSVTDRAGNTGTATRTVKVIATAPDGIVIDGNKNDWTDIPDISNSFAGTLKATNKNGILYLMVNAPDIDKNTQIFLDTDIDSATGFQFGGEIWNQGGADYMIENSHIYKSKQNSSAWAWKSDIGAIEFVRQGDFIEAAIPMNILTNVGSTINIGFVSRDAQWNVKSAAPETGLVSYTLNLSQDHVPFANMPNVSSIVKVGDKWFGISGKEVLQDDGASITTIFTSPVGYVSLHTALSNTLLIKHQQSKGSNCRCINRGSGRRYELLSYDLETEEIKIIYHNGSVYFVNNSLKDFVVIAGRHFTPASRQQHSTYYYKIDKNLNLISLGNYMHNYSRFSVISTDRVHNELHVKIRKLINGHPVETFKKVTSAINVGLEDE